MSVERIPVQAFAGDEYDEARALRAGQRSAPEAVAAARGENTTSNPVEETMMNDSSVTRAVDIREAIDDWAAKYAEQADGLLPGVTSDADFQEWAAQEIRHVPEMSIGLCARRWIDVHGMVDVAWPEAATPSGWSVEVGACMGGEVTVSLGIDFEDPVVDAVGAALAVLVAVVVDVSPTRTSLEPGAKVGDFYPSKPSISWWGVERADDADAVKLAAFTRVLLRANDALPSAVVVAERFAAAARSETAAMGALS